MGFEDINIDEFETVRQRAESKCPYDEEPFVITIRALVKKYPGKELFSYDEVREEGYVALGGAPLCSCNNEIGGMVKRLCKEINAHDGIEITAGAKFNSGKTKGLRIVVHRKPQM